MDVNIQNFTRMFAIQEQKGNKGAPGSLDQLLNCCYELRAGCVFKCAVGILIALDMQQGNKDAVCRNRRALEDLLCHLYFCVYRTRTITFMRC